MAVDADGTRRIWLDNPADGGAAWHYVDPRDVARAFRCALETKAREGAYFISAHNTLAPEPTLARLARFLGREVPVRRSEVYANNSFAPLYDLDEARAALGFEPVHDRRSLLYPAAALAG
jgi:nucleoside-diphosphate-sugar epimerase